MDSVPSSPAPRPSSRGRQDVQKTAHNATEAAKNGHKHESQQQQDAKVEGKESSGLQETTEGNEQR